MPVLKGLSVSGGIAAGPVLLLRQSADAPAPRRTENPEAELVLLRDAVSVAKTQLERLYRAAPSACGEESSAIFEIQSIMLEDEDFIECLEGTVLGGRMSADYAVFATGRRFMEQLRQTGDEYMAGRAADVDDLSRRLIGILRGEGDGAPAELKRPVIVAAEELLPSQTVRLDKRMVLGFVSRCGAMNSHASILARSLGIPAVSELGEGFYSLVDGEEIIVDGEDGAVVRYATPETRARYDQKRRELCREKRRLHKLSKMPSVTKDGVTVELMANIGRPDEAAAALAQGAEGIGLFRSEFLYFEGDDPPSEQSQFEAYRQVLRDMAPRRVVIRTLDLGADKQAPCLRMADERNPAMGYRAIRVCLDLTDIFKTQLRALLRASAYGRLAIMLPMITCVEEVRGALRLLEEVRCDLRAAAVPFSDQIELGVMIETPAAVVMADKLAETADFFSIGTNDLIQYTFAADRTNARMRYLHDLSAPAILRMIRHVVREAHMRGRRVGICGEMAADLSLLPCYIACGADELSMSPQAVLRVREAVRGLNAADCKALCDKMLG
ncbi:MAG: phosphoenolpyruvate--protein phosphotransferase [Oscillospiraceae bacterium]|jgi:phosphotransferase system enzyme I (PtsI)|nr:phosphoenolpyruvate--protein phosphotransferase [Oscillospiraceae bacterium]